MALRASTAARQARNAMTQLHQPKLPIHRLPLPAKVLQRSLTAIDLEDAPSAQRRATIFPNNTRGVWARVAPMWSHWPIRITKAEALEMGVDVEKGQQIDVEDVLRRWDPNEVDTPAGENGNGLQVMTSQHRLKLDPLLLGVSEGVLEDSLPHLDIGEEILPGGAPVGDSPATTKSALTDILSGRKVLQGSEEDAVYGPWSTRYCGHQFGVWAGQLGDGRAMSLLETTSEHGGRQEIQVKGAGRTPFSRSADGLAVLRSGVREYLGSEAMAALGIPTTRALAILTSPISVIREDGPELSSLVARVAPSFIRIGHFEAMNPGETGRNTHTIFLGGGWQDEAAETDKDDPLGGHGNLEGLRELTAWIKDDVMELGGSVNDWFIEVVRRNAETVAAWQVYGFMHGVLNTDNISILGLTIDYGPYAFMDRFNPMHICNHSDPTGLYNYQNQPSRVLFALDSLATSLLPVLGYEAEHNKPPPEGWSEGVTAEQVRKWEEAGLESIKGWNDVFNEIVEAAQQAGWRKRFGLRTSQPSDARDIVMDYLYTLRGTSSDFHHSLRLLSYFEPSKINDDAYRSAFVKRWVSATSPDLPKDSISRAEEDFGKWLRVYAARVTEEEEVATWQKDTAGEGDWQKTRQAQMLATNPRFVLRQWVLEEVIKKMDDALQSGDVQSARAALARVLKLSLHPFETYGESSDGSIPDPTSCGDDAELVRLCGLGPRSMLGFQCSCSS